MAAADALVGEGLSISPWKEALAEKVALIEALQSCIGPSTTIDGSYLPMSSPISKATWIAARAAIAKETP